MAATTELVNSEFLEFCQQGDLSQVTEYVQQHQVDVNSVEAVDGNTGLMLASREDTLAISCGSSDWMWAREARVDPGSC